MTEAEIVGSLLEVIDKVLVVFSTFFAIISGYVAALFFFLGRAPFLLKSVAFSLLSVGLFFLGGTTLVIQNMQQGLLDAFDRRENPTLVLGDLRNPIPDFNLGSITQQELGVATGWAVAGAVYLMLFYLTFIYRWPDKNR
ncbi:MAG: hypothetical protein ACK5KM_11175 [Hyphomicrobiaceae bacterium]